MNNFTSRVVTVREKQNFFQGQGKVREISNSVSKLAKSQGILVLARFQVLERISSLAKVMLFHIYRRRN